MNPHEPFDGLIRETEKMDGMLREMDRANLMVREMERVDQMCGGQRLQEEIGRCTHPPLGVQEFGERANSPFDSLIEDQEALSKRIKELTAPSPAFPFSDISPPEIMPPVFIPPEITPEDSMRWLSNLRIPIKRIETHLPEIHFPESRSLAELQQVSDDEIRAILDRNVSINTVQIALRVLAMRHLERATRTHWSVVGTFWSSVIIGAIGVVIGAIGVLLMLR